ncbi:MAG: anti-sigma factor [Candidatus Binatia bacterium]
MTCADFEKSFDEYVDDTLDPGMAQECSTHIAKCRACDREVTRWQQTRILLSTAVADFATAVDVSSVRSDVFAALGMDAAATERRSSTTREAAYERGSDARRSGGRSTGREAAARTRARFGAVMRFTTAATASALTAAAAVMLLTPGPQVDTQQFAKAAPSSVSSSIKPVKYSLPWSNDAFNEVAQAVNTPPPLARPETSHVDGLEAAPGQLVSTWVQPRTNARVIWVQDRGVGAPIRMAGLGK